MSKKIPSWKWGSVVRGKVGVGDITGNREHTDGSEIVSLGEME